ncbi:coiled-coil domain-containing protein 22 homolog [Paramacrobiotus metropolitanus]|uniref:coiled-coil domain-containing protein 22 homolog n=1 Tax=Paramacrobiotus metropolitanus TaxID=2943436 RepID=UPI0024464C96|nr:coiled-coil domain-containing protein 22 homolog [Paramacrobiotus metropolitanus]
MAEVDGIIIQTLRKLGCEVGDDVLSIRDFPTELLVQSAAVCLRAINPQLQVPTRLSASMATKYRQAAALADACKTVGYPGEIGYEAFLYGGENEVRKLLLFLMDKLPKEESGAVGLGVSAQSYGTVFARDIELAVKRELQRPWLPMALWDYADPSSSSLPHSTASSAVVTPFRSQRITVLSTGPGQPTTSDNDFPVITQQIHTSDPSEYPAALITSIVEFNSLRLVGAAASRSRASAKVMSSVKKAVAEQIPAEARAARQKPALPPRKPKLGKSAPEKAEEATPSSPPEVELTEEEKAAALNKQVQLATDNIRQLTGHIDALSQSVNKTESAIREGQEFLRTFETTTSVKRQVAAESAEGDVISENSVQKSIDELNSALESMHEEWEASQVRMASELTQIRQQSLANEGSAERLKDEIRQSKQTASQLHNELAERDDYVAALRKEYERVAENPSSSRTSYTKRILEIVANIKKQRAEIDKIIRDTRLLQKEINQLSGRLDRAFTETDELMFRDARNDEFVRRAYKQVAAFHELCSCLIGAVETTGLIVRETKDLEDEVDAEMKRDKETNLQRIREDLAQVKKENAAMTAALKR